MAVVMSLFCLQACGPAKDPAGVADDGNLKIVATIFPEYDWVMNILGDNPGNADVTLLVDNGVDFHSYQPSADDILKISTCDMFIYVGGESDKWVDDALNGAANKDMAVINLLEVLGDSVREEETVEGMQESEDEEAETGEKEYDEHVWLSLRNAETLTECISKELQEIDAANAQVYDNNCAAYIEKLDKLDKEYSDAVSEASLKTLLFGDRFPFRYLTDDYGLSYYAAFAGCSAETEASFETVTFLAGKVDELSLPAVMAIDGSDQRIAETIVQNTKDKNQQILTLDSMQSVTAKDVNDGTSYLSVMENDLAVLKEALAAPERKDSETEASEETQEPEKENSGQADADELFDSFLKGEIAADDNGTPVTFSELVEYNELWEKDNTEERLDLDNDGEDELMLAGGVYGGIYLDVTDGKLRVLARGDGTADMLGYTEYEGAVWIVHSDVTHMGRSMHHLDRYEGYDRIVDSFDINAEYWDSDKDMYDENSDFTYRGQKITMQEYEKLMKEIFD